MKSNRLSALPRAASGPRSSRNILSISIAALLSLGAPAFAVVENFSFSPGTAVPDATYPFGLTDNRIPATTINVIQNVTVSLNITGGFNGDLYGYLRHVTPGGTGFTVLLNRVGTTAVNPFGYGDAGFNVTLSDAAATDIHLYVPADPLAGLSFQPDGRNVDPLTVTDASPRTTALSSFNGLSAKGTWTLFLADASGGAVSTLTGYTLNITGLDGPFHWKGGTDSLWTTATGANWAADAAGTTNILATPDATSEVIFSTTGAGNRTTTLGADFTISKLTVSDTVGAVQINGANTLTLSGLAGTGIDVQAGAVGLVIGSNVALAGASDTITVNNTNGATISGLISGSNGLKKAGTGALILTNGGNNYTGGTTINGGTLLVNNVAGSATGAGSVTVNAGGTFGGSGIVTGPVTLNSGGSIAPGATTGVPSTATLTTGALTWNGGGTLQLEIGTASDLLAINGALTKGTAGVYGVNVTDAGGFGAQKNYTLATFTGGSTFAAADFTLSVLPNGFTGTLSLDADSLDLTLAFAASGAIIQNSAPVGTPTFADFTVNGPVTTGGPTENNTIQSLVFGPGGSLTVNNTLFVTGGPVNLPGGSSILLNGTLSASQLNMFINSLLSGNGGINGSLVNNGLVSPGNSPGAIRVSGNFTQSRTGTLRIEVGGTSEADFDRLIVGGHANLDGTLELVRLNNFKLRRGDKITFLTANGGVDGEFFTVSNPFTSDTILEPTVVYGDTTVALEMVRGSFEKYAANWGLTPNQRAVAGALDSVSAEKPNDKALVYLDERKLEKLPGDFDKIAPEELTSIFTISTSLANVQSLNLQRRTDDLRAGSSGFSASGLAMQGSGPGYSGSLFGAAGPSGKEVKEMKEPAPLEEKKWGAFLTGVGEWVDVGGDGNARGYDITTGGFTLGLDYKVCPNFALGIAAGYAGTAADLTNDGRVWVNGGKLGIYATTFVGGWYADAAVTGGYNSYDTKRSALQGTARGDTEGGELNVLAGTGYDWKVGALTIGPTATFQYTLVGIDGFTETGSLAPLNIAGRNAESVRTALGFKASYDWKVGGVLVRPEIRASWQHEYGDSSYGLDASFANGAGGSFLVNGPEIGRDSVLIGAGVAIQCSERFSTYFYYDGEIGRSNYDRHGVSGGLRVAF